MKIKELKKKYKFFCNKYVEKFCKKQELINEGWVNNEVGGMVLCSDFYFHLHDIVLDINSKQPKGEIINWHFENLDDPEKHINYYSYTKGLRVADISL